MTAIRQDSKLDFQKVGQVAANLKAAADQEVVNFMAQVAINTLGDAYVQGYNTALDDYGLQTIPAGVTSFTEVVEEAEESIQFFVDSDENGHIYLIPAAKRSDWDIWFNTSYIGCRDAVVPNYAVKISNKAVILTAAAFAELTQ